MKSTIRLLTLASLLALAWPALATTIKIGTPAPQGSPWHVALQEMAEEWERISEGSLQVRIYAGGVAGNEPDLVRKMRIGQLQAAALSGQDGLSQIASEMRIFETPMLIRTDAELDHARAETAPVLEALMIERGFRVLGWSDVGWVYLFANRPVVTPDDARRIKIRVGPGDAGWIKMLKDRGYHPIPLPMTEIHTGLQSGLIDAFTTPPAMALSTQWFGLANHMLEFKWAPLTAAVIISERVWQSLPESLRPSLEHAAREAAHHAQSEIRRFEAEAIAAMKQYGLAVNPISSQVATEWERELSTGYSSLLGSSVPEPLYRAVKESLERYRAEQEDAGDARRRADN